MARMRKVIVYVFDINDPQSEEDIAYQLRNTKYMSVHVGPIQTADIGPWHDDHELNKRGADYEKYFK